MEAIGPLSCTKDGIYLAGGALSGNVYLWEVSKLCIRFPVKKCSLPRRSSQEPVSYEVFPHMDSELATT